MAKQPGKGTRTKRERGAYGNKRGKEAQKRRREVRLRDPRVATTLDEVRAEQAALEARIEREKEQPAVGATAGAKYKPPVVVQEDALPVATGETKVYRPKKVRIPYDAQGNKGWTLGQARSMVRQGYKVTRVVYMTGWGMKWFEDLPTDDDGYGLSTDDWVATL
jgi:hypothetical protein